MEPADDPEVDYKQLVERGYDRCASAYNEARVHDPSPELGLVTAVLSDGASVLDIGSGGGVPVCRRLAERFRVTGVDLSAEQVRQARQKVPEARFIHGDIMAQDFAPASFAAIVSFYTVFHLPRDEHAELLSKVARWLEPGGHILITLARHREAPYIERRFFGVTMYWSNFGIADYEQMVRERGFTILKSGVLHQTMRQIPRLPPERHPGIFARLDRPPTL